MGVYQTEGSSRLVSPKRRRFPNGRFAAASFDRPPRAPIGVSLGCPEDGEVDVSAKRVHFWRTKGGAEVDFVLGSGEVAIEVKGTSRVDDRDLRSLRAFGETHRPRSSIVVCNESAERIVDGIRIIPWKRFFSGLWEGRIIA